VSGESETAWLIERTEGGRAVWWTGSYWTTDSREAIRFARRIDAERAIPGWLGGTWRSLARATEHVWSAGPPAHEDDCRCETCKVHA